MHLYYQDTLRGRFVAKSLWTAKYDATWDATRDATWDAALALLIRDRITHAQFDALYGPWASVMDAR